MSLSLLYHEQMATHVYGGQTHGHPLALVVAVHRFRFSLEQAGEREASMLKALEIAARITEAARSNMVAVAAQAQQQGSGAAQQQQQPHPMAGLHPAAHSPITESFIPDHMNHEIKAKRAQDLRRVTLTALSQQAIYAAANKQAAAVAAATAAANLAASTSAAASSSCGGSQSSCGSCNSSSNGVKQGQQQQQGQDEGLYTIHQCMRPELNCGHAEELEVAASG